MAEPCKISGVNGKAGAVQVPTAVSVWVARVAYFMVFAWNVACAVQFIGWPGDYVAAYQLSGPAGEAALRGLGVAFLMWNATYPLFLWKPTGHRVLGAIVIVQQAIGLVGELVIASGLPEGFDVLTDSIARFVGFDAIGLLLMACAYLLLFRKSSA